MADMHPSKEKSDTANETPQAKENVTQEARNVRSLAETAEATLLEDLRSSLEIQSRKAIFACGSTVNFALSSEEKSPQPTQSADDIPPIDLRFGENGKGMVLTLPTGTDNSRQFKALLSACKPAPFGRGREEIFDEGYRKASKLDREAFATNFCPYEAGIIDVVAQLLLSSSSNHEHKRSIKAELYKLNIYSAPNGKFKAHVDTPRSKDQIGSLVVRLPVDHEGGQLTVRNSGKELTFDWSQSAADGDLPVLQWAAFYSDCEHEVHEVTSGHRLTLTYNLYSTRGLGHLAGIAAALDPSQLPLYQPLKSALENPGFLPQGRVLAIWLTHSYAHTNKHLNFLPSSLKGADMALYEVASAHGLWCQVVLVMQTYDGRSLVDDQFSCVHEWDSNCGELHPEWKDVDFAYKEKVEVSTDTRPGSSTELQQEMETGEQEAIVNETEEFEELQVAYVTYGNEPGIGYEYSRAAMLIRIPPFPERPEKYPKSFWSGIKGDDNADADDNDDEWNDTDEGSSEEADG